MAYNKFIKRDGTVMLDLTDTTVSAETLAKDITAVDKYGNKIVGTLTDSPLPVEVSAEEEMTTLLTSGEIGSVYKYVGTTGTYENDALYEIVEDTDSLLGTWVFNDTLTIPDFINENEIENVYINIEGYVILPFLQGINNYIELINNIDFLLTSIGATNFVNTIEYVSGNNDNFIKASVNYLDFGSYGSGFAIAPIKNELPIQDIGWNFNAPITSGTCCIYTNDTDELLFEYNFEELLYHFLVGGSEIYNSNGNGFYDNSVLNTVLNTWTFTGGQDINNPDFVSWVQANATKQPSKEFAKLLMPIGTLDIIENGEYDVSAYVNANVNVEDSPIPVEVSTEEEMTVLLENGEVDGVYKYTGETGPYENDALYIIKENYCLTFTSPETFTLNVMDNTKYWDGVLEYSTDAQTWNEWDGTTTLSSSEDGNLYMRGIGNTIITGSTDEPRNWVLTGSNISCSGNIETLLDYKTVMRGEHPQMGDYCFAFLFVSSPLVTAPALPATTLANFCYAYMFGDTGLTTAPQLPATTLTMGCYAYMFAECTSLTTLPELPATTLTMGCYGMMFAGCTNIKLSETQTDEYQNAYRIPASGEGVEGEMSLYDMFTITGGTFTGTPTINTTYYTSNEIVDNVEAETIRQFTKLILKSDLEKMTITANGKYKGEYSKVIVDVEKPQLYAPSITITDNTLTITPNTDNGSFENGYLLYVDNEIIDSYSTTTIDLSTLELDDGTYSINVKAIGTDFEDSELSNSVSYEKTTSDSLIGTWVFNDTLTFTGSSITFRCYFKGYTGSKYDDYEGIVLGSGLSSDTQTLAFTGSFVSPFDTIAYTSNSWVEEGYKTIEITSDYSITSDFSSWLQSNATKQPAPTLISFTIDEVVYQAEEGMTWEAWVESEYNTGGFNFDGAWTSFVQSSNEEEYVVNTANEAYARRASAENISWNYELNIVSNGVYETKYLSQQGESND